MIGGDFLLAYKAIKAERQRRRDLKRFLGKDPDYKTIEFSVKNIALATGTDILAIWTFPNGTKLEIKKADAFDRFKQQIDPERQGAY
jgi:hypothetical protein